MTELKAQAKERGLKGYSKLRKADLEKLIAGASKSKPAPKSKTKESAPKDDTKQYEFDFYYTGSGSQMNQFVNDVIDLKSNKTNRKVGIKSVRSKTQKFLNDKKKKGEKVSIQMVKKFLDDTYPSSQYYEDM